MNIGDVNTDYMLTLRLGRQGKELIRLKAKRDKLQIIIDQLQSTQDKLIKQLTINIRGVTI